MQDTLQAIDKPPKPLLIGITGRAGAGKSTVARMLEDRFVFVEMALADPIVNMIGSLFADCDIDGAWAIERSLKELPTRLGYSYRQLAQTLGTEWGRHLSPDFWLRVLALRLREPHIEVQNVVISDVRFPNEADFVKARGGVMVRVLREQPTTARHHASEVHTDMLSVDTELLNFGSQATLLDQVERLVQKLRT